MELETGPMQDAALLIALWFTNIGNVLQPTGYGVDSYFCVRLSGTLALPILFKINQIGIIEDPI